MQSNTNYALFFERYHDFLPTDFVSGLTHKHLEHKTLRVNTSKISPPDLLTLLTQAGFEICPDEQYPALFHVNSHCSNLLAKSWQARAGLFYFQSKASYLPAQILSPLIGETVLDLAAAPGSKTTQLSQLRQEKGLIIANDINPKRRAALAFNLEQQGCANVQISGYDGRQIGNLAAECFDRVLLDAPCSLETYALKKKDFFKYWSLAKVQQMANLQRQLLVSALKACKKGGTIVYSTCTLAPEENEINIKWLLDNYADFLELEPINQTQNQVLSEFQGQRFSKQIQNCYRILPDKSNGYEAFFIAKIRKTKSLPPHNPQQNQSASTKYKHLSKKDQQSLFDQLNIVYQFDLDWQTDFALIGDYTKSWLICKSSSDLEHGQLQIERPALPFGRQTQKGYRLSFPFCLKFGHLAKANYLEIDQKQALDFCQGKNIPAASLAVNPGIQQIIRHQGFALGRAILLNDGTLKNQTPPAFVRQSL